MNINLPKALFFLIAFQGFSHWEVNFDAAKKAVSGNISGPSGELW